MEPLDPHIPVPTIPNSAIPVDVTSHGETWRRLPLYSTVILDSADPPLPHDTFATRVSKLERWEKVLLEGVTLVVPVHQFIQQYSSVPTCAACDGSVNQFQQGSYGWKIGTTTGQTLAYCSGPAFGGTMSSYRAEGYGMLSYSLFLRRMFEWYAPAHVLDPMPPHSLYCDNSSLVETVISILNKTSEGNPNQALATDWDVIMQIEATQKELQGTQAPAIRWIRGHQDQQTPYEELCTPARYNVDADFLANQYLTQHPEPRIHAPVLPASGIQLTLNHGTITSSLKRQIRDAATVPALLNHLSNKYDWGPDQCEDVHWTALGRALRRHQNQHTTLVKHLAGITPIGRRVARYHPKYPIGCQTCMSVEEETDQHLLCCTAPSRQQWRTKCIEGLWTNLQRLQTNEQLAQLLVRAIQGQMQHPPTPPYPCPQELLPIWVAQDALGWNQILQGRMTKEWGKFHEQTLGQNTSHKNNGTTWTTAIIDYLFGQWLTVWKQRNEDRHGREQHTKNQAALTLAIREATALYSKKGHLLPQDEWMLEKPLEEILQWPYNTLKIWLTLWTPLIEKSYQTQLETG